MCVCILALAIRHEIASSQRPIIMLSVNCIAGHLPTLSHKRHDFGGDLIKHETYFLSPILSETFLIPRRIQGDIIINVHRSSYEVPVIHDRF